MSGPQKSVMPLRRRILCALVGALEFLADGMAETGAPRPSGPCGLLSALPPQKPVRPKPTLAPAVSPQASKLCQGSPIGCFCRSKGGEAACNHIHLHFMKVGATLPSTFFSGTPQQHALMNRHLLDYFNGRRRAQESTPYNVPASQRHLLSPLGMEQPQPDAPEAPHALHKSIEEHQLRGMRRLLPPSAYNLISIKDAKTNLLPPFGRHQCPAYQAKDPSRYPGKAVKSSTFAGYDVSFAHDISSVVTPNELAQRLSDENPEGHLFVTGVNPIEVLDRARTFEPASHTIEYDLDDFHWIMTGSESESYTQSIVVTQSWLRQSSVTVSNGRTYHVVLLDYKLGHCLWHIFCGDVEEQDTRVFPTGSMVRLPPAITGTLSNEFVPLSLLAPCMAFVGRTPDLRTRNTMAKVSQVANGVNPKTTSREQWIVNHIMQSMAASKDWSWYLKRIFWNTLYALSFQWQMFRSEPDIYSYLDERKRTRIIHPTPGGGWSESISWAFRKRSIPNYPSFLQRVSVFTSSVFTFLLPKIVIGDVLAHVIWNADIFHWLKKLVEWTDIKPLRATLTVAIIIVTAILPGHVVKLFSRLAGHFWRQLWMPGWATHLVPQLITEVCGGPGAMLLNRLPGRGWFYQALLWAMGIHSVLPGLLGAWVQPWVGWFMVSNLAFNTVWWPVMSIWLALIFVENLMPYIPRQTTCQQLPAYFDYYQPNLRPATFIPDSLHWLAATLWSLHSWTTAWPVVFLFWLNTHVQPSGNCSRVPDLPMLPVEPITTVRRRNVDVPLPSVTLLPAAIPGPPAGVALAVDPVGMNFADWLAAVSTAYQQNPNAYPALTPGYCCFWECVAEFGGTPHLWYSWYMAYRKLTPDLTQQIGPLTIPDMQVFSAISHFGLNLGGMVQNVTAAQGGGWPTINLTVTRSAVRNFLHVAPTTQTQVATGVTTLARILRTIRGVDQRWFNASQVNFNQFGPRTVPRPTAWLQAAAGNNPMPTTMQEVADAYVASLTSLPIGIQNTEGFNFDRTAVYAAPWIQLFNFTPPAGTQLVANEPNSVTWQRFRSLGRSVSKMFRLPHFYPHPANDPDMRVGAGPLVGAVQPTPSQSRDNRARNNTRPDPPRWHALRSELADSVKDYMSIALPPVPLTEELLSYTADVDRASRLAADLRAHPSVLESRANPEILAALDAIIDQARLSKKTVTVPVRAYFGVYGAGKTTATCAYLKSLSPEVRANTRIVSHTESLRASAKFKLDFAEMRGFNFPTLASIITEPSTGPIVLDDAGKFWGGVIDLILLTNPLVEELVVNGDPLQGVTGFPVPGTQSEHIPTAAAAISSIATKYATITHRGFRLLNNTLGVHGSNPIQGHITHTVGPKAGVPVCTASPRYVQVLKSAGREAYTYESIQGEDFKTEVEIDITGLEGAVMDRTGYVALTRSSHGLFMHAPAADPSSQLKAPPTGSDIINAVIYAMRAGGTSQLMAPDAIVKACFYRHMHWCMPNLVWFAACGATLDAGDYQTVANPANTTFAMDAKLSDECVLDHRMASAGPVDELEREVHFSAKEHREVSKRGQQTDQFKDVNYVNPHVHKRNDTPTYLLSVEKRLTPATVESNTARMIACPREDMCSEYDRLLPHPPQWSAAKHADYVDRARLEYESKRTSSAVHSKLDSHDPLRTGSDITISLKNQVIKKDEKRWKKEAIAGQLIHEYDISQTMEDAPYALFLEDEIISAFPPNFLFYRRMSPDEFKEAYMARWRVGNGVHCSDVTRWDVGCDAGMLNFDVHVMRRSAFPEPYIRSYIERRLSSRSQHGVMQTMQNSGDRYTWALNSLRRAVVTSIVCAITTSDTCAVNGDDAAVDRELVSSDFPDSPWEFKSINGKTGEFSGFELGGPEPYYSGTGLHYRTLILESRDPSAADKWVNYMDLLSHAKSDDPYAISVARYAKRHMNPALFHQYLPEPFLPLVE